ncbi:hypothetical protein AVEN_173627-1 [Araneus ventricosus]|uniref:BTB domain-containing protein n=1 Tax=Araneus ventricosus TaxID=182803 RepID=A0A4Y2W386_ARAVE|nr:hypothetical protein AVEN_173627-1 [Araneus ventricosus]
MDWPARSPDLNPIEHVWDTLGRAIANHNPRPRTIQEMKTALPNDWDQLPQEIINCLISSMKSRCKACISSSHATSVSYHFVLKWILKGKDLKNPPKNAANASVIRSDLYLFKAAKDLRFYLEIEKSRYNYAIRIKGSKMWSFELAYAFFVSKEKAFYLNASNQLSFLPSCRSSNILDEEDVPIHCVVIVDRVLPSSSTEEDDLSTEEDDLSPKDGQNTVDIGGTPDITLAGDYMDKMVIDFIRRGDIPNFDVSKAIQIIHELKKYKCEVLKILCVQYLMENITSQTLRQISRAAIDCGLPFLERACMEKIANGYIQTK